MKPIEPFGYFRAEPFGWTACAETDDGAVPLYDKAAIDGLVKQRDELLAALKHYGTHLPDCDWLRKVEESDQSGELPNECSCGLANVKGGV